MGLLRADLFKLARLSLLRWLVVALVVLALLRGVVWPPDPDLPWSGLWSTGLVTTALIMLTAVSVGLEFSEDTFRSLVSRGVPRWAFLLSKYATLVLIGGVLLVATEGLATLLGVRSELRWGEVWRAWLGLWPYVALIMLLTVLARNGGLALVVGVIWVVLENLVAGLMGPFAMLPDIPQFRFLAPDGTLGMVFRWSLSFNDANWTYLAEWQRAPTGMNLLMFSMSRSALCSALVLAGFTLLGLGISLWVVHRRDMTELMVGRTRWSGFARRRARPGGRRTRGQRERLPTWTGRGPLLVRLVRTHLFKAGQTSLVKIGLIVSLLFPLALWGSAKAMELALWGSAKAMDAAGFGDALFGAGPEGGSPLAVAITLLVVGPLATVIASLAVSNELSLGTRRAELTRGVTRLQTIVSQSLALMLTIGVLLCLLMAVVLALGAEATGTWAVGSAALAVAVAVLAAGAYVGAVQIGGALTRSPLGALLFGIGFLVADWFGILTPTLMLDNPGHLLELGRYAVFANTFALANRGQIVGVDFEWPHLGAPVALLLLFAYTAGSHALAVLIARWRDA
jgi:ABC-type transport system involved in multi-copper enzyme maturation permease subunit